MDRGSWTESYSSAWPEFNNTVCTVQNATRYFLVFSMNTCSNCTQNDSSGICSSQGFRNASFMFDLMKFWLKYSRLKTMFKNLFNFLLTLWKLSLVFNLKYLSQFFIKSKDQGQFWNTRGVYFVPKFYNCPKARQVCGEKFYNCPQFARWAQWNILKFARFVPFVVSIEKKLGKFRYNFI